MSLYRLSNDIRVEYETLRPLAILIHPGSPNDTKIFDEMLFKLIRRRSIGKGRYYLII